MCLVDQGDSINTEEERKEEEGGKTVKGSVGNTSHPLQCPSQWHLLQITLPPWKQRPHSPIPGAAFFQCNVVRDKEMEEATKELGKSLPQVGTTETEGKDEQWDASNLGAFGWMKEIVLQESLGYCSSRSNSKCWLRNQHLKLESVSLSLAGVYKGSMSLLSGKLPEFYLHA